MIEFGDNKESKFILLSDDDKTFKAEHCFSYVIFNLKNIKDYFGNNEIKLSLEDVKDRYIKLTYNINLYTKLSFYKAENVFWCKNAVEYLLSKDTLSDNEELLKLLIYKNLDEYDNIINEDITKTIKVKRRKNMFKNLYKKIKGNIYKIPTTDSNSESISEIRQLLGRYCNTSIDESGESDTVISLDEDDYITNDE